MSHRDYKYMPEQSARLRETFLKDGRTLTELSRQTEISRTSLYTFLYNGRESLLEVIV